MRLAAGALAALAAVLPALGLAGSDAALRWALRWHRLARALAETWDHLLEDYASELRLAVFLAAWAAVRRSGVVVKTGQHALRYTLGRAGAVLGPGFHPMLPFVQAARLAPTRSRSLDLEPQSVTTFDGLVYRVEANLVWRIADLKKALIEVDDLVKGMLEMLGLGVQEVVRAASRERLRDRAELDAELEARLAERLAPWGVAVEHAGFGSITPTRESLRVTQLARLTGERGAALDLLLAGGADARVVLGLLGTKKRVLSHGRWARERDAAAAHRRRVLALLLRAGLKREQIRRAALPLRPGERRAAPQPPRRTGPGTATGARRRTHGTATDAGQRPPAPAGSGSASGR